MLHEFLSAFHVSDPHEGHFFSAFLHSVMMVIATEIGDRTFFIAAILAMSTPPLVVFLGCWGALFTMTVLSALIGLLVPTLLSPVVSHWICVGLFTWFGFKAMWDACQMYSKGEGEVFQNLSEYSITKLQSIILK